MELRLTKWTENDYNKLLDYLKNNADEKYKAFHSSLVPTADRDSFLGIRMPKMREIGREISKGNPRSFLGVAKTNLYEEKMLKGIVTGLIKTESCEEFLELCDSFVGIIDNWAICDCFCAGLKQAKKYRTELFEHIGDYLESEKDFIVRAGLVIMLDFYLDELYIDRVLERCDGVRGDGYYVKMAQAWLVATAFAKCRDKTLCYLHKSSLDDWTFNKSIQKCVESLRISDSDKQMLRNMKK